VLALPQPPRIPLIPEACRNALRALRLRSSLAPVRGVLNDLGRLPIPLIYRRQDRRERLIRGRVAQRRSKPGGVRLEERNRGNVRLSGRWEPI